MSMVSNTSTASIVAEKVVPEGHMLYDIEAGSTDGKSGRVSRRFSHFVALDSTLRRVGKGHGLILPKLPPKSVLRKNFVCTAEAFKAYRHHGLQDYLSALLSTDLGGAAHCLELFLSAATDPTSLPSELASTRWIESLDGQKQLELPHRRFGRGPGDLYSLRLPASLLLEEDRTASSDFMRSAAAGAVTVTVTTAGARMEAVASEDELLAAFDLCRSDGSDTNTLVQICKRLCSVNFWMAIVVQFFRWDMRHVQVADRRHGFWLNPSTGELRPAVALLVVSSGRTYTVTVGAARPWQLEDLKRSNAAWMTSDVDFRVDVREEKGTDRQAFDNIFAWNLFESLFGEHIYINSMEV
mmetsp:Transcript_4618/g.7983  ORF Transcript_4618/g.7983 Transcript_4618/m.7983 type:complete len:354 (+) Transcript_4618:75-1136(+)